MLIRDSLRRLLQLQIGVLIPDFVTGLGSASTRSRTSFAELPFGAGVLDGNQYSFIMKQGQRMLICALAGVVLCTSGNAATSDAPGNPYQGIVDRNVFGLKSPPPPPDPEANKPPPPKVFLTGITTILGNKRALLKTTPPAKPGEPAKEQSFTLGEGQRDGEIEVLEIDEKAGTVKVNDYGTITTLDFDKNGVKVAGGVPPAPGAPGAPAARPGGFVPGPVGNPFPPAGGANALPRPMR